MNRDSPRYFSGGCIIFNPRLLIALLLSVGTLGLPLDLYADDGVRFVVRPKLCVLSKGEEECRDTLELSWQSNRETSVCLFRSDKVLPLRCWENESKGVHLVAISTDQNIEFQLREINDRSLLVAERFEVRHDQPELRRRKRNPWSIF